MLTFAFHVLTMYGESISLIIDAHTGIEAYKLADVFCGLTMDIVDVYTI